MELEEAFRADVRALVTSCLWEVAFINDSGTYLGMVECADRKESKVVGGRDVEIAIT